MGDFLSTFKNAPLVRIGFLLFLILILQIPVMMIYGLIGERERARNDAETDIASTWGGEQLLLGPILAVPFRQPLLDLQNPAQGVTTRIAYFLPSRLTIQGDLATEKRYRGIFEIPVYRASFGVRGSFQRPDFAGLDIDDKDVLWDDAHLVLSVTDLRAINDDSKIEINGERLGFEPGIPGGRFGARGIHVPLANVKSWQKGQDVPFDLTISLNGSKSLKVAPIGDSTDVTLNAPWPDPKFSGSHLPVERQVTQSGFQARWRVPHLGRDFPRKWIEGEVPLATIMQAGLGVDFLTPVDAYRMTERSVKYELVIVFLTFLSFYLFELFSRVRGHPIQYLLVGSALCLFYLLSLSLAEHLGYPLAYAIASGGILLLVTSYSFKVLKSLLRAIIVAGLLGAQYGLFYALLMVQDYALLIGSLALFAILGLVMYLTRDIDWYRVHEAQ